MTASERRRRADQQQQQQQQHRWKPCDKRQSDQHTHCSTRREELMNRSFAISTGLNESCVCVCVWGGGARSRIQEMLVKSRAPAAGAYATLFTQSQPRAWKQERLTVRVGVKLDAGEWRRRRDQMTVESLDEASAPAARSPKIHEDHDAPERPECSESDRRQRMLSQLVSRNDHTTAQGDATPNARSSGQHVRRTAVRCQMDGMRRSVRPPSPPSTH